MGARWLLVVVFLAFFASACGDDSGPMMPGDGPRSSGDGDGDGDGDTGDGDVGDGDTGDGDGAMDAGTTDAGSDPDAGPDDPFDYDAASDYKFDDPDGPPPPVPDSWTCADSLWADGVCDCGCSASDHDCVQLSCTTPGCSEATCDACFTREGTWQSCDGPANPDDWRCAPGKRGDGMCDCGCGIPDAICNGLGCTEPGCYAGLAPEGGQVCDRRHSPVFVGDRWQENEQVELMPPGAWKCGGKRWGDGVCDCGCGSPDPDCGTNGGCTDALCWQASCDTCRGRDYRPVPCEAVEAGWDDDVLGSEGTYCDLNKSFGTGDGCDCGCGGIDPDCVEGAGCTEHGCVPDDACVRCTMPDGSDFDWPLGSSPDSHPVGCNVPQTWLDNGCWPQSYGTGDGCDCGCGVADPDCGGMGSVLPGDTPTGACDICHTGVELGFQPCPGWTCTSGDSADAFFDGLCDCGCGKTDPDCLRDGRTSCTEAGCAESYACERCNDGAGARSVCSTDWTAQTATAAECDPQDYAAGDGICDCGCGVMDPDCGDGEGCIDDACNAPGCDVCHTGSGGNAQVACLEWTCDVSKLGTGDGCDCGCGAPDPDCEGATGTSCLKPGCRGTACLTCHDDFGRVVPCP